jgi:hypothetical protein
MKFEDTPPFKQLFESLKNTFLGGKIPIDIWGTKGPEVPIAPANRKITEKDCLKMARQIKDLECDPSPVRNRIVQIRVHHQRRCAEFDQEATLEP